MAKKTNKKNKPLTQANNQTNNQKNAQVKPKIQQFMSDTKLAKTLAAYYEYQRVNKVSRIAGLVAIVIYLGANVLLNTPQRQQLLMAVTVLFFAFAIGLIFFVVRKALAFSSPLKMIARQQNLEFKTVYEDFVAYAEAYKS